MCTIQSPVKQCEVHFILLIPNFAWCSLIVEKTCEKNIALEDPAFQYLLNYESTYCKFTVCRNSIKLLIWNIIEMEGKTYEHSF